MNKKGESVLFIDHMTTKEDANIDTILCLGRYTILICAIAEFMIFSQLGNLMYMTYAGAAPSIRSCGEHAFDIELRPATICKQLRTILINETCEIGLKYDFKSVNVEFGYYCEETAYVKYSISIQMIGVIFGALLFGHLSDRFGRRITILFSLTGCGIFGILSAFTNDLSTFTIYRTAIGFFTGGQMSSMLVFVIENIPKKDRLWINTVISWSLNVVIFAIIAYYCGNWRLLALVTAILSIPTIILCAFSYESPRWLIEKGRFNEVEHVLERITKLNGQQNVTKDVIQKIVANEKAMLVAVGINDWKNDDHYYLYHLFQNKTLAIYTTVLSYTYFATSIVNYGLLFNIEKLSGSIYTNSILLGLIRLLINIASALADYMLKWFGRRAAHTVPLIIACAGFSTYIAITNSGISTELKALSRAVLLITFAMPGQMYLITGITSNELFPTSMRSIALSFLQNIGRIGGALAPQLFFLSEYSDSAPYLAMLIFGLTDMVLFLIFIPETKGCTLTSTADVRRKSIGHAFK